MSIVLDFKRVYHGTNLFAAKLIQYTGILLNAQRELTDFGKGFYVTPNHMQAIEWSQVKSKNPQVHPTMLEWLKINKCEYLHHQETKIPAYLTFDIDITRLLHLNGLIFPMPGEPSWHQKKETWKSFVQNCRRGLKHPYDFVYGPVGGRHDGTYTLVKPIKIKKQLSLNSVKALRCLSNYRITVAPTVKTKAYPIHFEQRGPINSSEPIHPFLKEIRNHLIQLNPYSWYRANEMVNHSWLAEQLLSEETLLWHESPAYWAFFILYGESSLWYQSYERYMKDIQS
ncbi:hypothetical protein ACNQFZ_20265 [Schinkia sp. CFF1]